MFTERTDLALEMHEINVEKGIDDGIQIDEYTDNGIKVSCVKVTDIKGSKMINKPIGKYITINIGNICEKESLYIKKVVDIISKNINKLIDKRSTSFLVVGLGNREMSCDSLGPKVVDGLIVTRHIKHINNELFEQLNFSEVASIIPGVMASTGIESAQVIKSLTTIYSPDVILVVDSLASRNIDRLCKTIQMTDSGIMPGSGVKNDREKINYESMGIPVISIGVPTVVDAETMVKNSLTAIDKSLLYDTLIQDYFKKEKNFFVSLKESDILIKKLSVVLSKAINLSLHYNSDISSLEEFFE